MRRRDFLKTMVTFVIGGGFAPEVLANTTLSTRAGMPEGYDRYIKDYLLKVKDFDKPHNDDIYLGKQEFRLLESCVKRCRRLQRTVGHGNFHLLNFDDALKIARSYSRVGGFSRVELEFLEKIFYADATLYGFFGKKPLHDLTARIPSRGVVKIPSTGNYVYRGLPAETYEQIKQKVGDNLILTSGVRSVVKQFLLFLNKAYRHQGNLSIASRSLAPPGYSYHGIGDFDVGQIGFGAENFTERFTTTEVYRRLKDLGYIRFRYPQDNLLGVRFEPWHIKVSEKV